MNTLLQEALASKPFKLDGALKEGASLLTGVVGQEVKRINGASAIRVRFKASKAGTLYVALLKHDQQTEEVDPPPRTIPVLDATEVMVEFDDIVGESYVLIKFTAGAATSVIDYCSLYRAFNPQTEGTHGGFIDDFVVPGGAGSYAPEIIYCNRDYLNAGVDAPSDLAFVSELQLVITTLIADSEFVVDLLEPGGDPETANDWMLDVYSFNTDGGKNPIALSRWYGVRVRAKSGGTGGTGTAAARWWN